MPSTTLTPLNRQTGSLIPAGQEDRFKKSGSVGLTEHEFLNMQVDEGKLYIGPLPIMSGTEDRDGEITEPDGLFDGAYKLSRPVYFNHLHAFDPAAMPIGTCETPNRKYDLHRTSDGWSGGTLFHDKTPLAEQTFALVVKGVIRGRSIGALDLDLDTYKPQVRRPVMVDGRIIPGKSIAKRHRQYEMVEFSWTAIPANAEIVTEMKSLLSRNVLEGRPLARELKYTLKSLNLSAPRAGVSSAEKGRQNVYSERFSKVFGKGYSMQGTPVAIQFDASLYSPDEAQQRLNSTPASIVKNRRLEVAEYDGGTVLKAVQRPYRGEVEIQTDARFPGVQLIFAKGGFFSQMENTGEEEDMPEEETEDTDDQGSIVEQILEQAQGGDLKVAEKKAPVKKPVAQEQEDTSSDEPTMKGKMPYGQEYLKAKAGHLMNLLAMSGDAMEGLEPEMLEKCGSWRRSLKALADEVQAYENERYAPKEDEFGEPVGMAKPEEKEAPEGYEDEDEEDSKTEDEDEGEDEGEGEDEDEGEDKYDVSFKKNCGTGHGGFKPGNSCGTGEAMSLGDENLKRKKKDTGKRSKPRELAHVGSEPMVVRITHWEDALKDELGLPTSRRLKSDEHKLFTETKQQRMKEAASKLGIETEGRDKLRREEAEKVWRHLIGRHDRKNLARQKQYRQQQEFRANFGKSSTLREFFGKHVVVPKPQLYCEIGNATDSVLKSIFGGGEVPLPQSERDDIAQLVREILKG